MKKTDVKKWVTIGLVAVVIVMLVKYALKVLKKEETLSNY